MGGPAIVGTGLLFEIILAAGLVLAVENKGGFSLRSYERRGLATSTGPLVSPVLPCLVIGSPLDFGITSCVFNYAYMYLHFLVYLTISYHVIPFPNGVNIDGGTGIGLIVTIG